MAPEPAPELEPTLEPEPTPEPAPTPVGRRRLISNRIRTVHHGRAGLWSGRLASQLIDLQLESKPSVLEPGPEIEKELELENPQDGLEREREPVQQFQVEARGRDGAG